MRAPGVQVSSQLHGIYDHAHLEAAVGAQASRMLHVVLRKLAQCQRLDGSEPHRFHRGIFDCSH
jgi:hypothetical protein